MIDKIEVPVRRKRLLPGQFTLDEALAKAAGSLVEDALKAMAERDREYEAWKKAKGDA